MSYADIPINIIQNELGIPTEDGLLFDVYAQNHANNALNGTLFNLDGANIRYRQILPDKNESLFGLHFEIMEDVFDGKRDTRLIGDIQDRALFNSSRAYTLYGNQSYICTSWY